MTIYLDNNATTQPYKEVVDEMCRWMEHPINLSTNNTNTKRAKKMLKRIVSQIHKITMSNNTVIFNSGASEGNAQALSCLEAGDHVVVSSIEHSSVLLFLKQNNVDCTLVDPDVTGCITVDAVVGAIKPKTTMVCVMMANNETGRVNPVYDIASAVSRSNPGILVVVDGTQWIGKYPVCLDKIDAFIFSSHKFCGPQGVGCVVLSKRMVGRCSAIICGTQQGSLRGGTENVAGIIGMGVALTISHKSRAVKNRHLVNLKRAFITEIKKRIEVIAYSGSVTHQGLVCYVIGVPNLEFGYSGKCVDNLPNTLLLGFYNPQRKLCNVKIREQLQQCGVFVSIGSACNTSSSKASHVVRALQIPPRLRGGILRVSFGDKNTLSDAVVGAKKIIKCVI